MSDTLSKALLDVWNLKTYFHTQEGIVKAVDDITFNMKVGETIGIVGESGSGKSVTALSIMRLIETQEELSTKAIVYWNKKGDLKRINALTEKQMQKYRGNEIAMIFQEPMTSLNPVFTCGYQVAEAIILHQKLSKVAAKEKALSLFEKVKLPNPERIFNAYPHQISGGQKQRVMIAMALSCNPRLLIADEPTTALDVTVQKTILDLLKSLKEEFQMSIIFISHDLGVIADIADRVLVMLKGKIVEADLTDGILYNPIHPYTKGLVSCRPSLKHRLKRLPTIDDFMEANLDEDGEPILIEKNFIIHDLIKEQTVNIEDFRQRQIDLQKTEPILQVTNLNTWFLSKKTWYGKVIEHIKAVDDVSFEVYKGETLGLVGESGCGKTTLGRTILKLTLPQSGQVVFDGKSIFDLDPKALKAIRKDMQIIFQDPYSSLNPRVTIGEAIAEPLKIHGLISDKEQRKQRVLELLKTVGLESKHYYRYPHEFSGGQRQRICIARALAVEPKFIICDESVSALDVSVQAKVLNLLKDLQEQFELTYIFISHDLSVVKQMSDRIMVMKDGKIEEINDAETIYSSPKSDYTRQLIDAIPKG